MKRTAARLVALLFGTALAVSPLVVQPAVAAPTLTVTPITWDVVGLDSNTPGSGPNRFPVGARVCAAGGDAGNVTAELHWDSANANIALRPGSLASISIGALAAGMCADAYFEAEVTKTSAAFETSRRYHITATDSTSGATASTPRPRQLYVEHLISQNRNGITSIKLDGAPVPAGGTMTLVVGRTYDIELAGYTATQGYNQLEAFITLANTVFQVMSVDTTYTANTSPRVASPDDRLYADACGWDNDPGSPNYRSCVGGDEKSGGTVVTTYRVRILGGAGTSERLSSLLYDFSGSSFHYNADYGVGARTAAIVGPEQVTISKTFTPRAITPGGTSSLSFELANPTSETFTDVNFTDAFPSGMAVAGAPSVTYGGCGAGAFTPALAGGETSLAFANGTIAPNSVCSITVNVTAPAGTHVNTTGHLFVETAIDTGNTDTDTLVAQAAAACTPGQTLASWTVPAGATNPPDAAGGLPTTKAAAVTTATASAAVPASTTILTSLGQGDSTSWSTYGYKDAGQYVDFVVDTSAYTAVVMTFHIANPGGANGPAQFTVTSSTGGAFTNRLTVNAPAATFTQNSIDLTGLTSTNGNTTLRVSGSGAKNNQTGANLVFDNITFTGCREAAPAPTIAKDFAPDPIAVGDTATLTFSIANTAPGSVALTGIAVTDDLPDGLTITDGSGAACGGTLARTAATGMIALTGGVLAAGGSCTFPVTVTGAVAGSHDNVTGFLTATESGTTTSYATDSLLVVGPPALAKAFAPAAIRTGETSELSFTIANPNRTASLSGIAFSDALPASVTVASSGPTATCGGSLTTTAPGTVQFAGGTLAANDTCTFAVTVTGATAGTKDNTTSGINSANGGAGAAASASLAVTDLVAALDLNKQVSADGATWRTSIGVAVGDDVYYRFSAYNGGDVPITSVAVDDNGPVACTWGGAGLPLAPGDTATCVIGPITALAGTHANTATATGESPLGPVTSRASTATYATTGLTLAKTADESSFAAAGDILHYTFEVANSGSFPLAGPVTVSDDKAVDEACPSVSTVGDLDGWLDPGESVTCTATYTVTADDAGAGAVTNTASAAADGVTSNTDAVTVTLAGTASLALTKASTTTSVTAAGQVVPYTLTVSNTGGVSLTGVAVDDPACDAPPAYVSGDTGDDGVLGVGEAWVLACDRTVTQPEIDAGADLVNTATADTAETAPASDTLAIPVAGTAALAVAKTSTTTSITQAGQAVPYTITLTNTGGSTLTGLSVTDSLCDSAPVFDAGDTGADDAFSPGEARVYTCTHTVTLAEVDAGGTLTNTATADTSETAPVDGTHGIPVLQAPALALDKTVSEAFFAAAGDTLHYGYLVTNTGNTTLAGPVTLTDVRATVTCPPVVTLAPAASVTCSATYTVTAGDVTAGHVTNTASATADSITSPEDAVTVRLAAAVITKVADPLVVSAPGAIDYTITVRNAGGVPLTSVVVADSLTGGATYVSGDTANTGVLDVGETWTYHARYTVTQAGIDAGNPIRNTASVTTREAAPDEASATTTVDRSPQLAVRKSADAESVDHAGQVVGYTVTVENAGNVTLTGITVSDEACDAPGLVLVSGDTSGDDVLGPGEAWVFTCDRTVTQADIDAGGDLSNTATAAAAETGPESDTVVIPVTQEPALAIVKTLTSNPYFTEVGDELTYRYVVTNAGNVTIPGPIAVTDDRTTVTCPPVTDLAPSASFTCTSRYTVTSTDLAAGEVTNIAWASASVGQTVVASTEVQVTASRVIPPTNPPSTSVDATAPVAGGWGTIALLVLLAAGLIGFAVMGWTGRRRRRLR